MGKGVTFTKHALERMAERNASQEFIETVVSGEAKAISFPSPKDGSIRMAIAKDGSGMFWAVIYSGKIVITVRRAHKPEEKRYEKAFDAKEGS